MACLYNEIYGDAFDIESYFKRMQSDERKMPLMLRTYYYESNVGLMQSTVSNFTECKCAI